MVTLTHFISFLLAFLSVSALYPTYNLDLEDSGIIQITDAELFQFPVNSNGYQSIYFESDKPSEGAFVDILMENVRSDQLVSSLCPLGIFQIDQNYTTNRYNEKEERIWIFVNSFDFNLTLCAKAIQNDSSLIIKRFETSCFRKISNVSEDTFKLWIPAYNSSDPFRCVWLIENPNQAKVSIDFTFQFGRPYQAISHDIDFMVYIEITNQQLVPTVINQTTMTQIISNAQLIAIEYIVFQPIDKQLQVKVKLNSKEQQQQTTTGAPNNDGCVCGRENIDQRVVGGQEVRPKYRYPWMVAFLKPNGDPFCGGAVINSRYILTAAHCFTFSSNFSLNSINLAIGAHNLTTDKTYYRIGSVKIHENYKRTGQALYNDIALVRLQLPINLNQPNIRPICLPREDMVVFDNLTVAGWGYTSEDGKPSKVLRDVTLPYVTNRECQEFHGEVITTSMMCAGGNQDEDSCQGDSGAPLMFHRDGVTYGVGLVSFGLGCGRPFYYGVYTRVSRYIKWVRDNTQGADYCPVPDQTNEISPSSTTTTAKPTTKPIPNPATTSKNGAYSKPIYPNIENCGITNLQSSRIVGGIETSSHAYPWMAAMGYGGKFIGGGVVIAPYYVLTSAHKIRSLTRAWDFNIYNISIILGAHDLTAKESTKHVFRVEKISFHPLSTSGDGFDYDFALLRLASRDELSTRRFFGPICLPRSSFEIIDGITTVGLGWGTTTTTGNTPTNRLRQVKLNLITAATCRSFYQNKISNSMFCAAKSGADMCLGDGGGPLMYPFRQKWYLLGIFSWGPLNSCAIASKPSVYADVRTALPWITYITGIDTL